MNFVLKPWQFALFVIAGWVSREQQHVIEYLRTENAVLRENIERPRVRKAIVELTLKFATENPTCGSDRIQGARANLGYRIRETTVGNIRLS